MKSTTHTHNTRSRNPVRDDTGPRVGASALSGGRRTASMREADKVSVRMERTVGTKGHRRSAVAIRESSKSALQEAADMMEYVLRPLVAAEVPGADIVLSHGIKLLEGTGEAEVLRRSLGAETIYGGVTGRMVVGWVLDVGGTLFVLSLFSAAKTNELETNDYTDALSGLLEAYDVDELFTGPFSRIARSKEHAQRLRKAAIRAGTTIYAYGRMPAAMASDNGPELFDRMVDEAVWDYSLTVERLQRGGHKMVMDGEWPGGPASLPAVGYKMRDPEAKRPDHTPVPDLAKLGLVRDLLTWKAEGMTDRQIAVRVADVHGWGSQTLRQRLGNPTATVMEAEYPEVSIRQIWKHIDLYATGRYVYSRRSPVGYDKLRRDVQEVTRAHGSSGQLFMEIEIDFHHEELPGGQWVDPAVIARARANISTGESLQGRAAATTDRKPLGGLPEWADGDTQWVFSARHRDSYILKHRPLTEAKTKAGRRRGWGDADRNVIGLINPPELHVALADAIVSALESDGVAWVRPGATAVCSVDPDQIDASLTAARKGHRRAASVYAIAADLFDDDPSDANRGGLRDALAEKNFSHAQLQAAEKAASDADVSRATSVPLSIDVGIEVESVALLAAALRQCDGSAPIGLNFLARAVLKGWRVTVSDDGAAVHISTSLAVTSDEGAVTLGPVQFTVSNRQRRAHDARITGLLAARFRDGMSVEDAAAAAGYTDAIAARRRMLTELGPHIPAKGLRSAAVDCPVGETRRVLWAMIDAARTGTALTIPADIDGRFARHIIATYSDPGAAWVTAWHVDDPAAARAAVGIVEAAGGSGVAWEGLIEQISPGSSIRSLRTLSEELVAGKNSHGGGDRVQYDVVLERSDPWHRHADRTVSLRTCGYCKTQTLTHICRTPEVPGGMLCTACARTPYDKRVTYPAAYLQQWVGPRGFGAGREGERSGTRLADNCVGLIR